jgi:hypothetical protein
MLPSKVFSIKLLILRSSEKIFTHYMYISNLEVKSEQLVRKTQADPQDVLDKKLLAHYFRAKFRFRIKHVVIRMLSLPAQ